jgi:hypothetical protein
MTFFAQGPLQDLRKHFPMLQKATFDCQGSFLGPKYVFGKSLPPLGNSNLHVNQE